MSALTVEVKVSRQPRGQAPFLLEAGFTAEPGITLLFGPSGAGKSTVLNAVAGLVRPDAGRIAVDGVTLFDSASGRNLPPAARSVAYVFQELALFPHLTVEQNVAYGLDRLPRAEREVRVRRMLENFRIAHLAGRKPREVSGGEQQRTALARSLVTEPRVLMLDEPLSGLDAATRARILDDLRAWNRERHVPVLYVTHDREEALALGERVLFLEQGRIVAQGTPHEVLGAPRRETVALAAGFENIFDATVTALHERQGTMTCVPAEGRPELEAPLGRQQPGERVRIAVRAGDILLAGVPPQALSARNVLPATIMRLEPRGQAVVAELDCGMRLEARLTPGAVESLDLAPGKQVWAVIKTYSCHLLAQE